MTDVEFHAPPTLDAALRLLSGGARPLAGGSDLIVQWRSGRLQPAAIIDLKRMPDLTGIRVQADGGWWIGAATPCAAIGEHAALRRAWPGVVEAAGLIGSAQVQGRATLGGNLCNASPAADSVPALIAAGAVAQIAGPNGRRELPVQQLPLGPGRTALAAGELLTGLVLPPRPPRSADAYLRLIPRTEMDIAVAGAAVSLTLDAQGRISAARVALGAVAPTAVRVPAAAEVLIDHTLDDDTLARAAAAARAACQPITDKRGTAAYRTHVAGVLVQRALRVAVQRALQGNPA